MNLPKSNREVLHADWLKWRQTFWKEGWVRFVIEGGIERSAPRLAPRGVIRRYFNPLVITRNLLKLIWAIVAINKVLVII